MALFFAKAVFCRKTVPSSGSLRERNYFLQKKRKSCLLASSLGARIIIWCNRFQLVPFSAEGRSEHQIINLKVFFVFNSFDQKTERTKAASSVGMYMVKHWSPIYRFLYYGLFDTGLNDFLLQHKKVFEKDCFIALPNPFDKTVILTIVC